MLKSSRAFLLGVLLFLLAAPVFFMARVTQMSLPLSGLGRSQRIMPPDPDDWCRKVDHNRLQREISKAGAFLSEGIGEELVDWRYLRKALRHTGVDIAGAEDSFWLQTIADLYSGCP